MKRYVFAFFMTLGSVIFAEPYKPYPILFVHGMGSNSKRWGVVCDTFPKWLNWGKFTDSIIDWDENKTFGHFLPLMQPYAWRWYEWEKEQGLDPTYTPTTNRDSVPEEKIRARFPNKCFLEVVNMDDPWG